MSKKFYRPFLIVEPLDPEHFRKGGLNAPEETTLLWTVEDITGKVISSHSSKEAAEAAKETAENNL